VLGVSSEYLLLPPRSAPLCAPHKSTLILLHTQRAPLPLEHRYGLYRHPFSEQPNSMGTLQHVSYRMTTSMSTAPLSIYAHIFRRYVPFRHLISREVHSSSPTLLTRKGPLERLLERVKFLITLWSIRSLTIARRLGPLTHLSLLYRTIHSALRCPARHFGGNQLPDSSIGLSPLHPSHMIDLNVRITTCLHPRFHRLHTAQA